jgi:dihydrofolate reductase
MGKLIVSEFVTLDGIMEAPGGEAGHPHSGWVFDFMGPDQLGYKLDEVREADALLLGRVTYEGFAAAWPERTGEFAEKMNRMPKYVVSTTLRAPTWNHTMLIRSDIPNAIARLKEDELGPVLVAGSRMLVHMLMERDFIDEYRLMVFPVVLGSGRRLFPQTFRKTPLRLTDVRTFASGVVVNTYVPAGR